MATTASLTRQESAPLQSVLAGPFGIFLILYSVLLLRGEALLNDPDTFWHIASGRWSWAHAAVPRIDTFSHSMAGSPWIAHEWLAELIYAGAYAALDWAGVVLLAAAAIALSFAILAWAVDRFLAPWATLALVAAAFCLAAGHLTARPHVLALPILALWVAALLRARDQDRAPSLVLLPVMTLWANLHGGFVIGLALAGAFALEAVLSAHSGAERLGALRHWGGFVLGAAIASLLTPHGITLWLFPLQMMSLKFSLGFVGEWHAADFSRLQPLELWLLGLLALGFSLRLKLAPIRLLLLLGFVHLALSQTRNADLLAVVAPLLLAAPLAAAVPLAMAPMGMARRSLVVAPLLLMALASIAAVARGYPHENAAIAPRLALDAARKAGVTGPVFNDYDFGGYLIFAGIPVFVDGRNDLYGDAFMRDYAAALAASEDALPRLLDRYRVTWTLLQPATGASAALDKLPGWTRLYADGDAVVHRRQGPAP